MTMGHRNGCQFCLGLHRRLLAAQHAPEGLVGELEVGGALADSRLEALGASCWRCSRPARRRVRSGVERLSRSRLQSRAGAGRRDWRQRIHADDFGEPTGRSLSHGIRTARPRPTTAANCVCGRALGGVLPTPGVTVDDRCAWRLSRRTAVTRGRALTKEAQKVPGRARARTRSSRGLGILGSGDCQLTRSSSRRSASHTFRRSRRSRPSDVASAASDLPSRSAQRTVGCVDRNTAAASSAGRTSSRTVDRIGVEQRGRVDAQEQAVVARDHAHARVEVSGAERGLQLLREHGNRRRASHSGLRLRRALLESRVVGDPACRFSFARERSPRSCSSNELVSSRSFAAIP